jgi:parallel beta-helix repeat protein
MKQKNMWKAVVAFAVVLAFVMPVAAFANGGTIGVTSNNKNTVDINNNIGGTITLLTRGTVYVDDDQLPGWYDATHVHTIHEGVTNATAGDTVYVYNGTYYDHVSVTKRLNLIGESRNNVIVNGSGSGNVFYITTPVTNVNISTFTITKGQYGIYILGSSNNTITNCNAYNNVVHGIFLNNSADNEITNCDASYGNNLTNNKYGIYLYSSNNNTIANCNAYKDDYGIRLVMSNNNAIANCNVYNNFNYGIYFDNSANNEITNCNVYQQNSGIQLTYEGSKNNVITNCNVYNNKNSGLYLNQAQYTNVTNCNVYNNGRPTTTFAGLYLNNGLNNIITNCSVYNNKPYGFYFTAISGPSTGNKLRNNTIYDNDIDFVVDGSSYVNGYVNDISTSNIVNGKPIYYLINQKNLTLDETHNIGFLGLVSCTNITVTNSDVYGIVLANTTHSTISNVNSHKSKYGIMAPWLSNSSITNCKIYDNQNGINIIYAYYNIIRNCTMNNNTRYATGLTNYGINIGPASFYNTVTNCSTYDNKLGCQFSAGGPTPAQYNRIVNCSIFYNTVTGISIATTATANSNRIYHNILVNNKKNASDPKTNFWNDTYPSGGNYWGNYYGVDIYSGPGQNITGSDGIGDTPYNIPGGSNKDKYPLMNPRDSIPPIITKINAKPQIQASSRYVNITCNVTDNVRVDKVKVNISGPYGFNIEVQMTKSGNSRNYYYNQTYALAGDYHYFIRANDTHGNIAVSNSYTFIISDLPISAVNPLPTWKTTTPFTVTATAYDLNGVNNVTLYSRYSSNGTSWTAWTSYGVDSAAPWSWSFTGADGYYQFYSIAVNIYGIRENPPGIADASTGFDTTKPVTTVALNPVAPDGQQGWYVSAITVTLSTTDGLSGVESTWYKIDAGVWRLYTVPFTMSSNGQHTIQYYSIDHAGNQEVASSIAFKIDTVAPITTYTLQGLLGSQGWYVTNVTVTLSASDATSGVNYTKYKLNNGNWTVYNGSFVLTTNGNYTLYYYSVDFAGNNETTKQTSFRIQHDVTPPVTTSEFDGTMGHNNWFVSPVTVTLSAVDDSAGVAFTKYKLNAGTWTTYTGAFLVTEDAVHTLAYYSVDKVGNTEPIQTATLKIDQTKPTINLTVEKIGLSKWRLTANVTDNTSGIARVEFYLDGVLLGNATAPPYDWNCTQKGTAQAIVYDNAGNSKVSNTVPVILDLNSNSVTNNQGAPGSQSQNQNTGSTPALLRSLCRLFNR